MADVKNYKIFKNSRFEVLSHDTFRDFHGLIVGENTHKLHITFNNGKSIICTPKHKIMINHADWVYADNIQVDDVINDNIKVTHIFEAKSDSLVYEFLQISGDHTYLANGALHHQCLILDELAFLEPASIVEDFWKSVWPTISRSKHSKVLIASTPNGTENLLYRLYDESQKGENDFKTMTIKWDAVPGRDEKWKAAQVKQLGSLESFAQEFDCVFHHKGESTIDAEMFERLKSLCSEPQVTLDEGAYKIWKYPEEDHIYVAGVDISEGVGQNYSVIQILDITDLTHIEQVAVWRSNTISPAAFTTKLFEILTQWGKPLAMIERNNCGGQVVDNLRNVHQYENVVNYGADLAHRKKEVLGVVSHTNTKLRGVLNLRYWVNALSAVKFNHLQTLLELKDFVRRPNGTWSGRGLASDDCVMSLVWALIILDNDIDYGVCQQYFEIEDVDENGKPKKLKSLDYGLKYFTKNKASDVWKTIQYGTSYGDAATLPMTFGSATQWGDEVSDLEMEGWTFL